MFKKVRKKFIISAMSATFVVTLALIISINLINYMQVTGNLKAVMGEMDPRQAFSAPQERDVKDAEDMTEPDGRSARLSQRNAQHCRGAVCRSIFHNPCR